MKLSKSVYEKATRAAKLLGSATLEEYIERIVERDADRVLSQTPHKNVSEAEVQEIANSLKGLGYPNSCNVQCLSFRSRFWSRLSGAWLTAFLYPDAANQALPSSQLTDFEITYPAAHHRLLGVTMHWIVIFFIVSLASGLLAAKIMKIEV